MAKLQQRAGGPGTESNKSAPNRRPHRPGPRADVRGADGVQETDAGPHGVRGLHRVGHRPHLHQLQHHRPNLNSRFYRPHFNVVL